MIPFTFILAQDNGNKVELKIKVLPEGLTQAQFAGGYLFPAMLHLLKGAGKVFDKELPIGFYFESETEQVALISQVFIKSRSASAIRTACLAFNEALTALAMPTIDHSIYQLVDMKGNRGAEFRTFAKGILRREVPLTKALAELVDN